MSGYNMFGARMRDSTMGLYGAGMPFGAPLPPAAPLAPAAPAGSAASDPEVQIIEPDSNRSGSQDGGGPAAPAGPAPLPEVHAVGAPVPQVPGLQHWMERGKAEAPHLFGKCQKADMQKLRHFCEGGEL